MRTMKRASLAGAASMTSLLPHPASVDERDNDVEATGDDPPALPPIVPSPSGAVPRASVPSLVISAGVASLGAGRPSTPPPSAPTPSTVRQ